MRLPKSRPRPAKRAARSTAARSSLRKNAMPRRSKPEPTAAPQPARQNLAHQDLAHQDLAHQDLAHQDHVHQNSARKIAFRFGLSAESRAAVYLVAKGYRIVARRWRSPVGEVDIVARR